MRSTILCILFLFIIRSSSGQPFTTEGYYLFPINPGNQNYLAGTMGELRSSHFHAGIDIKTGGKSGLPVYAATDGYVSRIKVSTGGYGHALYLTHPNGTTTVYAHLSRFSSSIDDFVLVKQYEEESFEVQLFPGSEQFTFRQGEIIAYSGNTGSSSGPHLHFEIRDANHRILDPLKFNFPEIEDGISPQIHQIAFVTLDGQARVNETYGRFEFDVLKTRNTYKTRVPISLQGNVGIELYAYDLLNGVYNRNGIPKTTLVIDGDTVFSQEKNQLAFRNQRNILVHMDYPHYRNGGRKFNKLFVEDGNTNDFYTRVSNGFRFTDATHSIKIYLEDSYGNISTFETEVNNRRVVNPPDPEIEPFEIYRDHLHFKMFHDGVPDPVVIYQQSSQLEINPYRMDKQAAYYLWNLNAGLPDSIGLGDEIHTTGILGSIPPDRDLTFFNHHSDITFYEQSLFDTLHLRFNKGFDSLQDLELFEFPHRDIPLRSNVKITLKPEKTYPDSAARVYTESGSRLGYVGGEWQDGKITFNTRDLVSFTIAEDTIPPEINPRIINGSELYFKINDGRSGIKSYRATLNGEFLLMYFEPKKDLIWAVPRDKNIPLRGEFILEVEDNTGNKSTYQRNLN